MKILKVYDLCRIDHIQMQGKAKGTFLRYGYHMAAVNDIIGNKDISNITLDDIRQYYSTISRGRQNNTVREYMSTLRQVFKYAGMHGMDCIDSGLISVPKRENKKPDYVKPEEVQTLIDTAFGIRNKFIISFLYASGVRISELIQLDINSISDGQFTVKGKGGKIRLCFIDRRTIEFMNQYLETRDDRNPALVISRQNNRISASAIQNMIRDVNERSGIKKHITPHTFRHGFCTNLMKNGVPVQDAAEFMGHSHVNTTMIYYHNDNARLKEIYEAKHTITSIIKPLN